MLWRAGLRISEALALIETDLDLGRGAILIRSGKGGKRREVGMDHWAWEQLTPWLELRAMLPSGELESRRRVALQVALMLAESESLQIGMPSKGSDRPMVKNPVFRTKIASRPIDDAKMASCRLRRGCPWPPWPLRSRSRLRSGSLPQRLRSRRSD